MSSKGGAKVRVFVREGKSFKDEAQISRPRPPRSARRAAGRRPRTRNRSRILKTFTLEDEIEFLVFHSRPSAGHLGQPLGAVPKDGGCAAPSAYWRWFCRESISSASFRRSQLVRSDDVSRFSNARVGKRVFDARDRARRNDDYLSPACWGGSCPRHRPRP